MTDMLEKMRIIKKVESDEPEAMYEETLQADAPRADTARYDGSLDRVASFFGSQPMAMPESEAPQMGTVWDDEPPGGPDVNRFTEIRELYALLGMQTSGPSTVYLLEEYMKTLPDSLPAESRRSIIIKLVAAAGFDFDRLLNDGVDRVARLTEHASTFAQRTDEIVARYNSEIEVLERQILSIRNVIEDRKNLHKKQFLAIETEAKRLREVLDFITK